MPPAPCNHRTYADSFNPPILHRKELLLPADDPRRVAWAALTAACESIAPFDDPRRIGYKRQWEQLVRERGIASSMTSTSPRETLTRDCSLARTLLVVSVMLTNQNDPRGQRFRDGGTGRRLGHTGGGR